MSSWRDLQQLQTSQAVKAGLPPGFFRLRYFHGKQMRLADYVDEQRYHSGKMRFHNEKLHGAGILCGLGVSVMTPGEVLLKVARGAAIDDCGREIVVGWDQCVDVDSWFQQQRTVIRDDHSNPCEPDDENRVKICVVLCYRECAGSPEPAPAGGCAPVSGCSCHPGVTICPDSCGDDVQYGRVAEEFELKLMFWDEAKDATRHHLFPTAKQMDNAIADAVGGQDLLKGLATPMRQRCSIGSEQPQLLLACFDAILDDNDASTVVEVRNVDHTCASQVLLSTEAIQYLLAALYAEADVDIGGPAIADISMRKLDTDLYQFALELTAPIEPASLDIDSSFNIRRLTSDGWRLPSSNVLTAEYADTVGGDHQVVGPAIYLTANNSSGFLELDGRYQLFIPASENPIVDECLRSLRPRHFNWRFGLEGSATDLVMAPLGVAT